MSSVILCTFEPADFCISDKPETSFSDSQLCASSLPFQCSVVSGDPVTPCGKAELENKGRVRLKVYFLSVDGWLLCYGLYSPL